MTGKAGKPTKITGVIRAQFARIEGLLKSGYTVASVKETIETELGTPINLRSFEWGLYRVRKERKEQGMHCIAQYNASPAPTGNRPMPSVSEAQPVIESSGDGGTPSPVPGEAEEQGGDAAYTPWKPERKVNPHLLKLKAKQDRGEI